MSLRLQLLCGFAYVLVLVLVSLEVPLALNLSKRVETEIRAQASNEAHLVAASASGRLGDGVRLGRLTAEASDVVDGRVVIVDRTGRIAADSFGQGRPGTTYASPVIQDVLDSGLMAQGRTQATEAGEEVLSTAVPIVEEGERVGAVQITQPVGGISRKVHRDMAELIGIGAAALLVGLGIAWVLAGIFTRPLRELARVSAQVAGGNLDARADVSGSRDQREVAEIFNRMIARLKQVLASQREFVANASHQLRTPLTGLLLRLEAAASSASDPAAVRAELEAAEEETQRLSRLLAGLLALAKEGDAPAVAEPVLLADAIEDAFERWHGTAARCGQSLTTLRGEPVPVPVSEQDLAVILDNLIENALHYSPPETTIRLQWGRRQELATLAVLDEGPGLEPGEEERVFDRFARGSASSAAPGTGLGLSIVRTLARRWGGEATIANRPAGGARAEVLLPLAALPEANRELVAPLQGVS